MAGGKRVAGEPGMWKDESPRGLTRWPLARATELQNEQAAGLAMKDKGGLLRKPNNQAIVEILSLSPGGSLPGTLSTMT